MPLALLIDPDLNLCELIEDVLKEEINDLVVYKAENGTEGVKIAKEYPVDLIVTNLFLKTQMPADKIIKQIKAIRPNAKIIIQSGYDIESAAKQDKETISRIEELGYDAYLVRVFNEIALVYAVKQALKKGQR